MARKIGDIWDLTLHQISYCGGSTLVDSPSAEFGNFITESQREPCSNRILEPEIDSNHQMHIYKITYTIPMPLLCKCKHLQRRSSPSTPSPSALPHLPNPLQTNTQILARYRRENLHTRPTSTKTTPRTLPPLLAIHTLTNHTSNRTDIIPCASHQFVVLVAFELRYIQREG